MKKYYLLSCIVSFCFSSFAQNNLQVESLHYDSIQVDAGWNLLSLPVIVTDGMKNSLFPTATSDAFIYENSYQPKDTLQNGFGFWLKFSSSETVYITGEPIVDDTINVRAGWNMIGSISSPIPINTIISEPDRIITSNYFGYTPGIGYQQTGTLQPGKGYWVKASIDGKLILPNPTSTGVVGPGGGVVVLPGIAAVEFPEGSFPSERNITITAETLSDSDAAFEGSASLFQISDKLSYRARINIGSSSTNNDSIYISFTVPLYFQNLLSPDHTIGIFVQVYQDGGEETLDNFGLFPSSYDETQGIVRAALPAFIFSGERNPILGFETFVTVAVVPRPTESKELFPEMLLYPLIDCTGPIECPLNTCSITSPFGPRWGHQHWGIDLSVSPGTPVRAADAGTVELVRKQPDGGPSYGWYIVIRHTNGSATLYGHLQGIPGIIVTNGQTVSRGEQIALSGNTGSSKGPHLHFEYVPKGVILSSNRINPELCLITSDCPPTVAYSGKTYTTVKIGSQCWLKENLDVGTRIDGTQEQTNNSTIEKYCYNNDPNSCNTYGGLYQWNEAMQYSTQPGAQGICPTGWHIPTRAEFQTLSTTVGGDGNALKAIGQGTGAGAGTNTSGFSALLAGARGSAVSFLNLGILGHLWSSTEDPPYARLVTLYTNSGDIYQDYHYKGLGLSVRCLKD